VKKSEEDKDVHSVAEGGVMDGRTTEAINKAAVGRSTDQLVNYADVVVTTGNVQRCLTVSVSDVEISAVAHQQTQYVHSASLVHRVSTALTYVHVYAHHDLPPQFHQSLASRQARGQ